MKVMKDTNAYLSSSDDNYTDEDFSSESEPDIILSEDSTLNEDSITEEMICKDDYISKDGNYSFTPIPPKQIGRTNIENIFRTKHQIPNQIQRKIYSPLSCLKQFITQNMIRTILVSTNHFIEQKTTSIFRLIEQDLWLWFAALFYMGIMKGKNATTVEMWDTKKGIPYLSTSNF